MAKTVATPKAASARNATLAHKLAARTKQLARTKRELGDAHRREAAFAELLKVILRSKFDLKTVLDSVGENAARLCDANNAVIYRIETGRLREVAAYGRLPTTSHPPEGNRIDRETVSGRAAVDRQTVHVRDLAAERRRFPVGSAHARRDGHRTTLATPLLRDGVALGVILIRRLDVRPFSDRQIGLLKTFADQATIAIENARLFEAEQTRTRELAEALERQTATSEVLGIISRSKFDIQPVLDTIVRTAARLCRAQTAVFYMVEGDRYRTSATFGFTPQLQKYLEKNVPPAGRASAIGRVLLEKRTVHIADSLADPEYAWRESQERQGFRTILAVPLLRAGMLIGAIALTRLVFEPFSAKEIELVETFADQAVIAIENARLFEEVQSRTRELTESLERQTATSGILNVISRSLTDAQPVFESITDAAVRLFSSRGVGLWLAADGKLKLVAYSAGESANVVPSRGDTIAIDKSSSVGRAVLECSESQIADIHVSGDELATSRALAAHYGWRASMSAPMLRDGRAIGGISVVRARPGAFAGNEIALLKTFADQAVIAIENARLFEEVQTRTRELTESLEQQTAIGEILRVISASPGDVQPVFDAVAERAARICEAQFVDIMVPDGDAMRVAAKVGELGRPIGKAGPLDRTTVMGRSILDKAVVHVADLQDAGDEFPLGRKMALRFGHRTILAVPLVRQDRALGTILVRRTEVRAFEDKHIALLQTFADQAAIAIENVRLFDETKEALERQTATSEVLGVISRSTTELRPVLDAIVETAARLCQSEYALIYRVDEGIHRVVATNNVETEFIEFMHGKPVRPTRGTLVGRVVLGRETVHIPDVLADPEYDWPEAQTVGKFRTKLGVPLLREGAIIGVITLQRTEAKPFSEKQIELVTTFADQAVIAIENTRLFEEVQARTKELQESLRYQTATSDVLGVISRSPTDVQPVFDAIVKSAAELFNPCAVTIVVVERGQLHWKATASARDADPIFRLAPRMYPAPFDPDRAPSARAILSRKSIAIPDALAPDVPEGTRQGALESGLRSALFIPLLREDKGIGALILTHPEAGYQLNDKQRALAETFADQAVIAIENARLFEEVQTRTRELTEALEQQTATAEILRVISSSLTDTQPVFDAIVASGLKLFPDAAISIALPAGDQVTMAAVAEADPARAEAWRRRFPFPLTPEYMHSAAILDRRIIDIPDVAAAPAEYAAGARNFLGSGYRAVTIMPMMRGAAAIGALSVVRLAPGPLTEKQIAILRTFADQAAIAIENVRLFNETKEALEQQTATADVLKVISRSTFDLPAVLETLLVSAAKLCDADIGTIRRRDGEQYDLAATYSCPPEWREHFATYSTAPDRGSVFGRTIVEGRTVHIPDVLADSEFARPKAQQLMGFRAALGVPLMRENEVIGVVNLFRAKPSSFTKQQIELVESFADQAVIAIENTRLFEEVQARTRELTEALEYQTATGDILRVISSSPTDIQPVFDTLVQSAVKLCNGSFGAINMFDGELVQRPVAHCNYTPDALAVVQRIYPVVPNRQHLTGRAILGRTVAHLPDVLLDPEYAAEVALAGGWRAGLAVPMLREGQPIGTILVARAPAGPFSERQINLLKTFADQAVIAIENTRLFEAEQARTRELTEALEQQTATAEILRVISSSLTDTQPVFDAIVASGLKLFPDAAISIEMPEGGQIRAAAIAASDADGAERWRRIFPFPLSRDYMAGVAILDHKVVDMADATDGADNMTVGRRNFLASGYRAVTKVPMMRGDSAIGVLSVARTAPGPLSDKQIAILRTFADQAVIAIENTRLLSELSARTGELSRSIAEMKALGEIGRAVSSSLDLATVLGTILDHACGMSETGGGAIYVFDKEKGEFHLEAGHRMSEALIAAVRAQPIKLGEALVGQCAARREAVQLEDLSAAPPHPLYAVHMKSDIRALLAVPLLHQDAVIGALVVRRHQPGAFAPETVALMQAFANQSAIAIQNARLFREIEEKGRQLEIASRHKSQFVANMSHELRTPLAAMLGYAELLKEGIYGALPEKSAPILERIQANGKHLLGLINTVLDISKIESGQFKLNLGDYAIGGVVEAVRAATESLAAGKKLAFTTEVPKGLPIGFGDEQRLTQVLLNLVGNAIKFTDSGEVRVVAGAAEGRFTLAVSDTGPGIPPAEREKIFEKFHQIDDSNTKAKGGTGLGLAIAKEIVEMHGGRLWVESTPGAGATFRLELPQRAAAGAGA